jgi:hypothetical protein
MCRRWNRILLAALIVLITFLYPLLAPTPHRIDPAHADLIVRGMTKEQVETIFGVPAGEYDWAEAAGGLALWHYRGRLALRLSRENLVARRNRAVAVATNVRGPIPVSILTWTSRHGSFAVWFDDNDLVSTNAMTEVRIVPPWQRWWNQFWKK